MAGKEAFSFDLRDLNKLLAETKKKYKDKPKVAAGFLANIPVEGASEDFDLEKLALTLNYGNETIPPRPFFDIAIKDEKRWRNAFAKLMEKEGMTVENAMRQVGSLMKSAISDAIESNIPPPNAPSTIKKKGTGKSTLVNEGTFSNSVVSAFAKKGDDFEVY